MVVSNKFKLGQEVYFICKSNYNGVEIIKQKIIGIIIMGSEDKQTILYELTDFEEAPENRLVDPRYSYDLVDKIKELLGDNDEE